MKTIFRVVQYKNKKYGVQQKTILNDWLSFLSMWRHSPDGARYPSYKEAYEEVKKRRARIEEDNDTIYHHKDNIKIFKTFPVIE